MIKLVAAEPIDVDIERGGSGSAIRASAIDRARPVSPRKASPLAATN
jgi:hypothetical protein